VPASTALMWPQQWPGCTSCSLYIHHSNTPKVTQNVRTVVPYVLQDLLPCLQVTGASKYSLAVATVFRPHQLQPCKQQAQHL
jgi:hypothetical protein